MKKAICPNYSCPPFALIYHSSHLFLNLYSFLFFLSRWCISLVLIPSVHLAFPHSALAVCSFQMFTASHPLHTPPPPLCEFMSFSWGLHFLCSQMPVYPLLLSSPCILHPNICCFFSKTALLCFSHFVMQLLLAFSPSN